MSEEEQRMFLRECMAETILAAMAHDETAYQYWAMWSEMCAFVLNKEINGEAPSTSTSLRSFIVQRPANTA